MHFYGWKRGLKTGMYYLRSRPAVDAIKFTVDMTAAKLTAASLGEKKEVSEEALMCSLQNPGECEMCSA